jgi:hypothetical protein
LSSEPGVLVDVNMPAPVEAASIADNAAAPTGPHCCPPVGLLQRLTKLLGARAYLNGCQTLRHVDTAR